MDIILRAADGIANHVIARNLATSLPTVLLWRKRFQEGGIPALFEDRPRKRSPQTDH